MTEHTDCEDLKNELLKKLAEFGFARNAADATVADALKAATSFVDQVRERIDPSEERTGLRELKRESNRILQQLADRSKALQRFHEGSFSIDQSRQEQLNAFRAHLLKSDTLQIRPVRGKSIPNLFLLYKIENSLEGSQAVGSSQIAQLIRKLEAGVTAADFDKAKNPEALKECLAQAFELERVKVLTAEVERLLRLLGEAKDETIRQKSETDAARVQVTDRDSALNRLHAECAQLLKSSEQKQQQLFSLNFELNQAKNSIRELEIRERRALDEGMNLRDTITKTTKEYEKQADHLKYLEEKIESLTSDVAIKDRELHFLRSREESLIRRGREQTQKSTSSFLKWNPAGPIDAHETISTTGLGTAPGEDRSSFGNQELSGLIDNYRSAVKTFSDTVSNELTKISEAKTDRNEQLRHLDTKIRVRQNEMKELAAAKAPLTTNLRQSPWQTLMLGVLVVIAVLHYLQSSRAPL